MEPIQVAIYTGLFVRRDAISTSARYKFDILTSLAAAGEPIGVTVFTHQSDYDDRRIHTVADIHDLARHKAFRSADMHLFEFGIRYELFNAVFLIDSARPILATYHNVTPPALADTTELREALEQSLVQKHNLVRADRILCDSEFNRDDLLAFGIPAEKLTVLHLPPAINATLSVPRRRGDVELLFVGRFVPAKGVIDLLDALAAIRRRGLGGFQLTLAGNELLSSTSCLSDVLRIAAEKALRPFLRIIQSPTDGQLARLYSEADALIMPSYHEGYCLPVIEALTAGCQVITYNSTNLPHILGGLGKLVPTGDCDALATAIADCVSSIASSREQGAPLQVLTSSETMPEPEWRIAVANHLEQHSADAYERCFLDVIQSAARLVRSGPAADPVLTSAHLREAAGHPS